jgi:hypothetical protein
VPIPVLSTTRRRQADKATESVWLDPITASELWRRGKEAKRVVRQTVG